MNKMNHEPLKVYVAGSSRERASRAVPIIAALRKQGLVVTHDWTVDMDKHTSAEHSDADVPDEVRRRCSELDANGVRLADFVLLLAPEERGSSGVWVELGMALTQRVPVVVCGAHNRRTIFTSLAHKLCDTDDEGVRYLSWIQEERG